MSREGKIGLFIMLLIVGAIIGSTNLLAPVHEFGHYITAVHNGGDAKIVAWNRTSPTPSLTQALAGYWMELLVFCLLGQFVAAIGYKKGWWWVSGFCFGYSLITMFMAPQSYDFNTYVEKFAEYVRTPGAIEAYKKAVLNRWILLCTAMLVVNVPIIYFRYLKRK